MFVITESSTAQHFVNQLPHSKHLSWPQERVEPATSASPGSFCENPNPRPL